MEKPKIGTVRLEAGIVEEPLHRWSCCSQLLDAVTVEQLKANVSPMFPRPHPGRGKTQISSRDWSDLVKSINISPPSASHCLVSAVLTCTAAHQKLRDSGSTSTFCWDAISLAFNHQATTTVTPATYWSRMKNLFGGRSKATVHKREDEEDEGDARAFVLDQGKFHSARGVVSPPKALLRVEWPREDLLMELLDRYPVITGLTCKPERVDQDLEAVKNSDTPWNLIRCVLLTGYSLSPDGSYWIGWDPCHGERFRVRMADGIVAGFYAFVFIPAL